MKNKCSSVILFIVVILPFTLFSYQNCSQLNSYEVEQLSSQLNVKNNEPMLVSDLQKIKYQSSNSCTPLDSELVFYSTEFNLCAKATNTCESLFLQENNFYLATADNCENAMNEVDMSLNSFSSMSPEELGYTQSADTMCTQVIGTHVNLFSRVCARSSNGCEASYLRDNKFIDDTFGLCD